MHKILLNIALEAVKSIYKWCKEKAPKSKYYKIKIIEREIAFRKWGWQTFENRMPLDDNFFAERLLPNDLKHWRIGYKMAQNIQEINRIIRSLKKG